MNDEIKQPYHPPICPNCDLETDPSSPFCIRCEFDLRYGKLRNSKRGKCIYCDKTDLSDEHIFPDWLSKFYPRRYKFMSHTLRRPERHVFFEPSEMHLNTKSQKHDPYTTQVRNVCRGCNNGWMSRLQTEAQHLVKEFADGGYRVLADDERQILARWAVMTSVNLECYARMLTTTEHQRQSLMNGSMPDGWQVYLGLFKNTDFAGFSYNGSVGVPIQVGEGEYIRLQNSFLCIEHSVFQTLSSANNYFLTYAKYGAVRMQYPSLLSQIWPLDTAMNSSFDKPLTEQAIADLMSYTYQP